MVIYVPYQAPVFAEGIDGENVIAMPFENYEVKRSGAFGNKVYPVDGCNLSAESLNRFLEWNIDKTQLPAVSSCNLQFLNINQSTQDTEGYLFYLSVPAGTTTTFYITLNYPEDSSRWNLDHAPALSPVAGKRCRALADGETEWKNKKLQLTTSNSESAKIEVPEQYQPAPIPVTPITGYTMEDYWYDKVSHKAVMPNAIGKFVTADGIEMKSVSGNALTYDSATNSEILAGANYTETMTDAYQLPTDFDTKGSFIFYVKIGGANDIYFSVRTECPGQWFTTGELAQNASYEYLPIGGNEWISATANGNLISFEDAFSGYIKVSVTSLKSVDNVYMSFTRLSQIAARFKNIGGAYGDIIAGPFFTTIADSESTKFIIPEEYQPAPLDIKSFDLGEVRASGHNFGAQKIQNTNNDDLYIDELIIPEEGSVKHQDGVTEWSYVENEDGQEALGGAACLIMNPAIKTCMKDAQGIVFYVELPKANMFSPSLIFGDQAIMLKPGATVQLLQNGSDEWTDATVNQGLTGNTAIYGTVKFDSAFSGYIKVPFTSLNSDWGWKPTLTGDNLTALTSVAVRFKGVGDDAKYGSHITVGLTGYYTADTARPEIGTIAIPNYPTGDANYDWR